MQLNSYIDHTVLKSAATAADVERICREAAENGFASVCINPCRVAQAKRLLEGSGVKVCTVIGFPLGANTTAVKAAETMDAYMQGCDEFDMVINVGKLIDGDFEYVKNDISAVVSAAGGKTVKVIIETGLLTDEQKVSATRLACEAGADFVKTCTGFTGGVATADDVRLIKRNIAEGVKIKASAGIKTRAAAEELIAAGADRLGTSSGVDIIKS